MAQKALILGAGELGMAILSAIAQHPRCSNTSVTVLLRQSTLSSTAPPAKSKRQSIASLGGTLEAADITASSHKELVCLFAPYDIIISCNGMELPSGTNTKIAKAVLAAGVKRFFPWQFGMDYDAIGPQGIFDEQRAVRTLLRAQDATKWTVVSTGVFMSFLFEPAFGIVDVEKRVVRGLGSWETQITATAPADIGRVTADLVLDPRETAGASGVVYTAGDTVSYGELADLVDAHFGAPLFRRELWDFPALGRQMEEDPNAMVKYRGTFAQGRGVAWSKERTVNHQRGIPMMDVEVYLTSMDRTE